MRPRPGQGESAAVWAGWGLVALATLATYSRIDTAELYHVSVDGLWGGLGRVVVFLNFPFALVAIALGLIALAALPTRAWWVGGPAVALCAAVAVPGVVGQADLDARLVNAIPASGVTAVLGLTVAAAMRAGAALAPRRPWDTGRIVVAAAIVLLSAPWLAAEVGFYFPGDVFLGEELRRESDGTLLAAVHYGRHHGFDGTLMVLTALLLSRTSVPGRVGTWVTGYLGLMLAYGSVNMTQDLWGEQVVKRGWAETGLPSAIVPRVHWIWAVILVLAVLFTWALRVEQRLRDGSPRVILRA